MPLTQWFRNQTSLRQGLILAGVFGAVLGIGLLAYFSLMRPAYSAVFTHMRLSDAAATVADLEKRKVPYRVADGGSTILVPAKVADTVRLDELSADPSRGQVGFELFNKSDMGLTEFAERINYQRALQGELARTIMTLDAVESARVHLSLPDQSAFKDEQTPAKASAMIIARPGRQLSVATVLGVRRLIAAAVPGLDPAAVVILNERGDVLGDAATDVARAGLTPLGASVASAAPAPSPVPPSGDAPQGGARRGRWLIDVAAAALVGFAFLAGVLVRRSAGSGLSRSERAAFVQRFDSLLGEEGLDGRSLG